MEDTQPPTTDFQKLFDQAAPALYAWGCLRVPPPMRMHVDPEDLVQEVWLRAARAFPRFDPRRTRFQTWLIGIAKNVLLEALRRLKTSYAVERPPQGVSHHTSLDELPDAATSVTRRLARTEELARLLMLVEAEQQDGAQLLALCGLEGLSAREAGTRLGLKPDAVAKRWQRLRGRIREHRLLDSVELLN